MKSISLYNKIFLIFIVVTVVSISIIGWYGFKNTSEVHTKLVHKSSFDKGDFIEIQIERKLTHVPTDTLFIKKLNSLRKFLIWRTMGDFTKAKAWGHIYEASLLDFLNTKEEYYSAQVIDLDGYEIFSEHYDKLKHTALVTKDYNLQDRSGYAYFEKAKQLKAGEFYISDIQLNMENGTVQVPHNPVIHFSTPIIGIDGKIIAIFVLTRFADDILNVFEKEAALDSDDGVKYYLIDKNGNYMYHDKKLKRWNKQLSNNFNFNQEHFSFLSYFQNKEHGSFIRDEKIYSFHELRPNDKYSNKVWYIVSSTQESIAFATLEEFKSLFVIVVLVIILLSFFLVRFLIRKITDPLSLVTEQLLALSRGEIKKQEISYKQDDEIGQIVRSTKKVVNAIEKTIVQANLVAGGDVSKEITLLSENDQLGLALNAMTKRLQEIQDMATNLSQGNYVTDIVAISKEDKLGRALVEMISYLETVTKAAESISKGEIDIEYKAVGHDDRLGIAMIKMIAYLKTILNHANAISRENFSKTIKVQSKHDELGNAMETMTSILSSNYQKNKDESYFSEGIGSLTNKLTGITTVEELSQTTISMCSRYVGASTGVLYLYNKKEESLGVSGSFAFSPKTNETYEFALGEGVVGQVGLDKKPMLLQDIKNDDYQIQSGSTQGTPKEVFVFPFVHEGELCGVIEMMSYEVFTKIHKDYLLKSGAIFATAIHLATQNEQIKVLLEKSQSAFEELQTQSEELQETNVQMEEQQQQLTLQSLELEGKNENLARAKDEIDKRADDLEKASAYKSEFLANMSHELRTPLNSIILLSKLLSQNQTSNLSEKDVEKASVINKSGNDLLFLINDILDLTKIESGNMELDTQNVNSSDILDDMKGLFTPLADDKNIGFSIDDNFASSFEADKSKLAQVLKNLLSNAIKFTKEGSVSLSMSKVEGRLEIIVKDSGIGIPADKIQTVFEAFKQADGSTSREFGGTGLGLSISKNIVDLMQGTIKIQSEFGVGTSFIVSLPLTEINEEVKVEVNAPSIINKTEDVIEYELEGKNILIVDDDSRNIFTLTSTLESTGAEIYSAFNGEDAIALLQETDAKIDIILMDIMMPVMDGHTAMKILKADENYKDIPIIAVTAKTAPKDKQECLDSGADEYLAKPIEMNALFAMMKAWIR